MASDISYEETFSGFGILNETQGSTLDVSRLITDEDLVYSLLSVYDEGKKGIIQTSQIIEYIKCFFHLEAKPEDLEELSYLLDPEQKDIFVDLETCRNVITEWTAKVVPSSELAEVFREANQSISSVLTPEHKRCMPEDGDSPRKRLKFDGEFSQRSSEVIIADLNGQIENLENQNSKLNEEYKKMREQRDTAEEVAASRWQTIQEDSKQIKSMQKIIERREKTLLENEDLKKTVSGIYEEKMKLSSQIKETDKLNNSLQIQVYDLESKLVKALSDADDAEKLVQDLQSTISREKDLWVRAEEEKEILEAQVNEKAKEVEELHGIVDDFRKINRELNDQKLDLEQQLSTIQQELALVRMQAEKFGLPESFGQDDSEPAQGPRAVSTPKQNKGPKKSLAMELKSQLEREKHLPSPLCEKKDIYSFHISPDTNKTSFEILDGLTAMTDSSSQLNLNSLLLLTDELIEEPAMDLPEFIDTNKEDYEMLGKKILSLGQAKRAAEQRASRFSTAYHQLKETNQRLRHMCEESVEPMCAGGDQLRQDNQIKTITEELAENKKTVICLKENVAALESEVDVKLLEIDRLKQNNGEVAAKFRNTELKAIKLEAEIKKHEDIITKKTEKCKQWTEQLRKSTDMNKQLVEDKEKLQDQCKRTQAALNSLKTMTLQLEAATRSERKLGGQIKYSNMAQTSPLVDALSFDVLGSNCSVRCKSKTIPTEDILYVTRNTSTLPCRTYLSISCPSLLTEVNLLPSDQDNRSSELHVDSVWEKAMESNYEIEEEMKKFEEDAFQRGFEEGVRVQLEQEMTTLVQEQKHTLFNLLDDVMDGQKESCSKNNKCANDFDSGMDSQQACPRLLKKDVLSKELITGLLLGLAVMCMTFLILPYGSMKLTVKHYSDALV